MKEYAPKSGISKDNLKVDRFILGRTKGEFFLNRIGILKLIFVEGGKPIVKLSPAGIELESYWRSNRYAISCFLIYFILH